MEWKGDSAITNTSTATIDASLERLLTEMRRLGDRIEGRCGVFEHAYAPATIYGKPAFVEESVFDTEPLFDDELLFNTEPIFDEEPIADEVLAFDAVPIFDEGPDDSTTAGCDIDISDEEPDDFNTVGCRDVFSGGLGITTVAAAHNSTTSSCQAFSTSSTDKEIVFNYSLAAAASTIIVLMPNNMDIGARTTCSMKCPRVVIDITASTEVCAVVQDLAVIPARAAATPAAITAMPCTINADAPSTCSTNCPSRVITAPAAVYTVLQDVFVAHDHVPAPSTPIKTSTKHVDVIVFYKLDATLDIDSDDAAAMLLLRGGMLKDTQDPKVTYMVCPPKLLVDDVDLETLSPADPSRGCLNHITVTTCASASLKCVRWQPWPPPTQLKHKHNGGMILPMPWPSFNLSVSCFTSWVVTLVWKPPWPLHHQQNIGCRECSVIEQLVQRGDLEFSILARDLLKYEFCVAQYQLPICPFATEVNVMQSVLKNLEAWVFGGSGQWSKLSDQGLRFVFLTKAHVMDMEYKRVHIYLRQGDPGIPASLYEISSSFQLVQCSVTLLVGNCFCVVEREAENYQAPTELMHVIVSCAKMQPMSRLWFRQPPGVGMSLPIHCCYSLLCQEAKLTCGGNFDYQVLASVQLHFSVKNWCSRVSSLCGSHWPNDWNIVVTVISVSFRGAEVHAIMVIISGADAVYVHISLAILFGQCLMLLAGDDVLVSVVLNKIIITYLKLLLLQSSWDTTLTHFRTQPAVSLLVHHHDKRLPNLKLVVVKTGKSGTLHAFRSDCLMPFKHYILIATIASLESMGQQACLMDYFIQFALEFEPSTSCSGNNLQGKKMGMKIHVWRDHGVTTTTQLGGKLPFKEGGMSGYYYGLSKQSGPGPRPK